MQAADAIVIGGGVAGLTAAALLAKDGARVTVFEHHNVPGGCASFYQRDGYRFDVGATVVNGFGERGIHRRVFDALGAELAAERLDPAMMVHVGDTTIARYGDARWNAERRRAFGDAFESFWQHQERLADAAWRFAAALPVLPVDAASIAHLARIVRPEYVPLVALQGRSFASLLPGDASPLLRRFVDLQLLITAQGSARDVDASFGATALDIAREGTYHLPGGIADIAVALARAVRRFGGKIQYATSVHSIAVDRGRATGVVTAGGAYTAERVIAAVPYENVLQLLDRPVPATLRTGQRWSAVTAYVGLEPGALPDDIVLHHQLLLDPDAPLGEGNSLFVSISAPEDRTRARKGGRAVTISTHTDVARWERARANGTLDELKADYAARLLSGLARVAGAPVRPRVFELGTPFTFERYTARYRGMVGGTPQLRTSANLLARSHRSGIRGLLLCGDTTFPGQSTVGVTLSAINAARAAGARITL